MLPSTEVQEPFYQKQAYCRTAPQNELHALVGGTPVISEITFRPSQIPTHIRPTYTFGVRSTFLDSFLVWVLIGRRCGGSRRSVNPPLLVFYKPHPDLSRFWTIELAEKNTLPGSQDEPPVLDHQNGPPPGQDGFDVSR